MSKTAKWVIILAVCVGLYAAVGFLLVPRILHTKLESLLTEQLGHQVTVKEVQVNPFALSLDIDEFSVSENDGSPLIGFQHLYVNLESSSVLNRAITFSTIYLQYPYAVPVIRKDGSLNLADLRPTNRESSRPEPEMKPTDGEGNALPAVIIETLYVDRGIVEFHDDSRPTPFTAEIVPITFALKNFTTRLESLDSHDMHLTAEVGPGEGVEWRGSLYLQPLRSEGIVSLTGIKTRTLWEYMKDVVKFEITDGVLNVKASYQVTSDTGGFQASLTHAGVTLTRFALGEKGSSETLVSIPEFSIDEIEAELATKQVRVSEVHSHGGRINGWLDTDGRPNLQSLFESHAAGSELSGTPSPPQAQSAAEPSPWTVTVATVNIENYGVTIEDRQPATPARLVLNPLNVSLSNVTSRLDSHVDLKVSAKVNETGTITAAGGFTAQPASAELDLEAATIALVPFQPYLDPIAQLRLQDGSVGMKGHLSYHGKEGEKPQIRYAGNVGLSDLVTQDTLLNKDFLKWSELAVNGMEVEVEPTKVKVSEVVIRKPYLRFIIGPDRTTNIQQILAKPGTPEPSADHKPPQDRPPQSPSQAAVPIQIGAIRVVDGSAHFADLSLKPIIDTGIFALNGSIKGLSSKELARADVSLDGKVDKYAPMSIKGQINPLTGDAFTDLAVSFKNVELTTVSPYSTKFAGYPIKKGKVSVDLRYKLSKKILEAENKVLIQQLTLGDKTDSPDATSLPVKLAIALLKDRNGVIDIDLPVRGDLNDPDFKYGKVLLGVLVNLITKAVTAPFNLIAGLVGGNDQELNAIDFPVGTDTMTSASQEKLSSLAKALKERPGLQLEVTGSVDTDADRAALAERSLDRELAVFDAARSGTDGNTGASRDITTLPEPEQAEIIRAYYVKKFGKLPEPSEPKAGQTDKPAPVPIPVLKERLLETVEVDEGEIRLLGQQRAKQIQDHLITHGGIAPERIFLLDVKIDATATDGVVSSNLGLTAS